MVKGEVSEWLKEHAWKACVHHKCTEGSNPSLSAITIDILCIKAHLLFYCFFYVG